MTTDLRSVGLRGAAAGLAGTVAEACWSCLVRRRHGGGRSPVYAPDVMAARLLSRVWRRPVPQVAARVCGTLMRSLYGPPWGIAIAALRSVRPAAPARSAIELAAVIWIFELLALPAVSATPPLGRWPRDQVALDAVNGLVYAAGAVTTLACLERTAARANTAQSRRARPSLRASAAYIRQRLDGLGWPTPVELEPDGSVRPRGRAVHSGRPRKRPETPSGRRGAKHAQDL